MLAGRGAFSKTDIGLGTREGVSKTLGSFSLELWWRRSVGVTNLLPTATGTATGIFRAVVGAEKSRRTTSGSRRPSGVLGANPPRASGVAGDLVLAEGPGRSREGVDLIRDRGESLGLRLLEVLSLTNSVCAIIRSVQDDERRGRG